MSNGSLIANEHANAEEDANALHAAMAGAGTDEDVIIDILAHRTLEQRKNIADVFETLHGKSLVDWIEGELSGHLETTALALFDEPLKYEAKCLKKAMKGAGTDEKALIQIITTKDNHDMKKLKDAYFKLTENKLKADVQKETSGDLRRILVSCINAKRGLLDGEMNVDADLAQQEAQELYDAGEGQWGTDESVFTRIICSRNSKQLKETFRNYNRLTQKSLFDAIESEFSGDLKDALQAICLSLVNKPHFYARALHQSMKGLGTNDETLIRLVVTRCEKDMKKIKAKFEEIYEESLVDWIKGDASGDYKKLLVALCGESA